MANVPMYVSILFILTSMLAVLLFCKANKKPWSTALVIIAWLALQSIISLMGFYTVSNTIPPRFALLVLPPLVLIIVLFATDKGKNYIDSLDIKILTLLHSIRIPVELCLLWLFIYKAVPGIMTFEGRNFDILSGITAILVYYFAFVKKRLNNTWLLVWNIICLVLLINIVVIAVLSAPFPFQKFAFDQPNIALLYFPFVWLPCCVVPIVLLSHLAAIRQLIKKKNN